jgi:hypothetical protein
MKKPEIIIWKFHNKDYVSYYARFENDKKQQGVQRLRNEQVKELEGVK